MPYEIIGNVVVNRMTGRKRKFGSRAKALRWVRYNLAREHGWKPTGRGKTKTMFRARASK